MIAPRAEPHLQMPPLPQTPYFGLPPYSNGPGPCVAQDGDGAMRPKQVRAAQACNHCRSHKRRCDEARPCQYCRENYFGCQYMDVPPPKQDRSMMVLQNSLNSISNIVKDLGANFNVPQQGPHHPNSAGSRQ
ncbi:hypothetical protein PMIN06_013036 [Paraphaeosphaeria minitans]